jgi:threonine dehydrogenase-like Zn-dependent dehydrogenase
MRARALHFVGPRRVEWREVDVPDPGPKQLLVRALWSGISSGTEMLAYRGMIDPGTPLDETLGALGGTFAFPFQYGYSSVGVTAEGATVFAFHPHQEAFVVDEADVVDLRGMDPRTATLFPLVETALQISLDAASRAGEHVVVAGLGAVGILTVAILTRMGAQVLASDPLPKRREAAAAFGAHAVSPDELSEAVRSATSGRGADVAVEVSGSPAALGPLLGLLAHEGTAVVASWYGSALVPLPLGEHFHRRRLRIVSSQVSTIPGALASRWDRVRRRDVALELLADLPVESLATHEFHFERAADAFAAIDRGEEDLIHAVLRYD